MSLTPNNPRVMTTAAWGSQIKLTPSPSPFLKNTPLRSPTKSHQADVSLALRQVIGTTTSSANSFDTLSNARSFAFCAGAAAVLATVDDQHHVSQRFFRARPTTNPINPSASIYGGPSTPTQNESRNRTAASLRQAGLGASPLGSPANDWNESPAGKSWSVRERIKAATCVSFSPDGKFLAVGETGYKPRVLIFSTASDAPSDTPLTALSEHTFGVKCLAWSPDSQYLASLGTPNDGFLYVWSVNSRTGTASLHASNKCTSNINRMAWMGSSLVTVGVRHVKVWRTEESNPARLAKTRQSDASFLSNSVHKTLPGRNCVLESLLEANFTSVVAVAPLKAVVASDKGQLCLIDDSDGNHQFIKVAEAGIEVTSMTVDSKGRLHLASSQGGLQTLDISNTIDLLTPPPSPPPRVESPTVSLTTDFSKIEAVGSLLDYLVTVDSQNSIRLSRLCACDDESIVGDVVQKLPAHGHPVIGVASLTNTNPTGSLFYTWSTGGTVLFWTTEGAYKETLEIPMEQMIGPDVEPNELKTVTSSADANLIVTGDKYGVLRIMDRQTKSSIFGFKAHSNEITGITMFDAKEPAYIATSSRDRMVQIFRKTNETWDLLQTLDEHVGAVTGVLFSRNGERLVSMSSDRSLVVRELVSRPGTEKVESAFLILRTIMLKSSPVDFIWDVDQDDVLLVSTIDRQVHKYDLRNGHCLNSFRASDTEGGDAVVLSSLAHLPRTWGSPLIAGVSSTDKSIRLYDENGTLVARDWGHTEGVRDIAFLNTSNDLDDDGEKSLVTVASDGTIFVWDLVLHTPSRQHMSHSMDLLGPSTPVHKDVLANKAPLRRVFSQSELARFQRSEDEQTTPTGNRSPKLRKKLSKFSLGQTPRLEPSPSLARDRNTGSAHSVRRTNRNRSPSPPSPRHVQVTKRRSSADVRVRNKAAGNEFGSLASCTESLCRTLRTYRKRLANSTESLGAEVVREVERELALTARTVGEKAKSSGPMSESMIQKLLDQYSERLVNILDEKISASVALHARQNSESASTVGMGSAALAREEDGGTGRRGSVEEGRGC